MATSNIRQFSLGMRAGARAGLLTVVWRGKDGDLETDVSVWTCPPGMRYRIFSATEIHNVKTETATEHAVVIRRQQGTEAPASGDALVPSFNFLLDAETLNEQEPAAGVVAGTLDLEAGNRLGLDFSVTGNPDSTHGVVITITLIPIGDVRFQVIP